MVTVPREVSPGQLATASISLPPLESDVTLTFYLSLKSKSGLGGNRVSKVIPASSKRQLHNIMFRVSEHFSGHDKVKFTITADDGNDDFEFKRETELKIKVLTDQLFIQTDKPIYKPGGKSKFFLTDVAISFIYRFAYRDNFKCK